MSCCRGTSSAEQTGHTQARAPLALLRAPCSGPVCLVPWIPGTYLVCLPFPMPHIFPLFLSLELISILYSFICFCTSQAAALLLGMGADERAVECL